VRGTKDTRTNGTLKIYVFLKNLFLFAEDEEKSNSKKTIQTAKTIEPPYKARELKWIRKTGS